MALSPTSSRSSSSGTAVQTLLYSLTLGADGSFDQASIAQTYNDLLLVLICRATKASATDSVTLRFNNDSTGANYVTQNNFGSNATAGAQRLSLAEALSVVPAASATANRYGSSQILIPGYASTVWQKTALSTCFGDWGASSEADLNGIVWLNTAAINRIQVLASTNNLLAGSTLRIYGIT